MFTLDEIQNKTTIISKENWSLESMFCRGKIQGYGRMHYFQG